MWHYTYYHHLPTTYHLPPTTYHLPPTTYHLPPTTYHLLPTPTTHYLLWQVWHSAHWRPQRSALGVRKVLLFFGQKFAPKLIMFTCLTVRHAGLEP